VSYWVVLCVNKDIEVSGILGTKKLPLCYAEGMVGAIPVFENKEAAEVFADGRYKVAEVEKV
jgi:hypothetical protein